SKSQKHKSWRRDSLNRQQKTASFRLNKNKFVVVSMQRLTFFEWANLIISDDKKENIRSSDEVLGLLDNCDPPAMVHISQSRRGSSTSTIMSHSTSQTKINDQFSTDVYYVPHVVIYSEATLPTIYGFFPIFRNIVLREKIDIVHGHQAFSSLCNEAILHARTMGMKACFTDHSLFGFADSSSILMNKLLKFSLSDIDHVICVSHTSKENTVLRAALNPQMVSVIPNAVLASQFKPDPGAQDPNFSNRLVYRKGMDLLVAVIPRICGDGPKRVDLEQMREKYLLHDRVELLGAVKHHEVRN
ncbi:18009_t:CDS:2, partial [Entrophospora sp. SA101]